MTISIFTPGTTAMMAILLILCIGYVVVASLLVHGARKVTVGQETINLLIDFVFREKPI